MTRVFSEVALTFNAHLSNLNDARVHFQDDVQRFQSEVIASRLNDLPRTPIGPLGKLRWRRLTETSKQREISWTNWGASTVIELDILLPGMRNFKRSAGILYFETTFNRAKGQFRFRGRFENQNVVSEQLDEEVIDLISNRSEEFPEFEHVKTNTAILFRVDLNDDLEDMAVGYVDASLQAIRDAVDSLFPDDRYRTSASATPAELDASAAETFPDGRTDQDFPSSKENYD